MKVILNEDVKYLGEEGDIKNVAKGYARNYLFPRNLAVPCNEFTLAHFESRKEEIEAKKAAKRQDATGLKEKLEALSIKVIMPAGPNGKLYGAVTTQTLFDELQKLDFDIERKRIEIPGQTVKSTGVHKALIKLYENTSAEISFTVEAQIAEEKPAKVSDRKGRKPRREEEVSAEDDSTEVSGEPAVSDSPISEEGQVSESEN
ncbi:50S ribosomal protein L9 [Treponema putidum]|uniref:Large ribosomal subunit protein bL9 n=1 Tax=Treponema putidum TaxID=221027 RepID=A0AAE9SHT6_9SPIR|nr:50S ribosomal protein L9 [Treponema putidum]AIN94519.1 50S ribosomal protein L9 [Treponema putidum]TWI78885.1 large subunit ribosomal protein L9 [Treponema putidum]UTY28522.1 50S ribosomal protein L9 [Treponema putidum]UTY30969.1 50S ribosomal protein L9 [Treponema putidum]UTY33390.1 50S ribosomal protein L9 [Treponema putidum]